MVVEKSVIVIEPATPQTVYVPVYSPTVVYGAWPYPAYPPVYVPPPPGYVVGTAFMSGLAFATGVAVVGSLWGWARPSWYGGNVNVNVNRYNTINVNRPPINSAVWRPPAGGVGGRPIRPPVGPVGAPGRPVPLPANAIGRPSVQVPASAVNRPAIGNAPGRAGNVQRPGGGQPGTVAGQRPGGSVQGGNAPRPGGANPPVDRAANAPAGETSIVRPLRRSGPPAPSAGSAKARAPTSSAIVARRAGTHSRSSARAMPAAVRAQRQAGQPSARAPNGGARARQSGQVEGVQHDAFGIRCAVCCRSHGAAGDRLRFRHAPLPRKQQRTRPVDFRNARRGSGRFGRCRETGRPEADVSGAGPRRARR